MSGLPTIPAVLLDGKLLSKKVLAAIEHEVKKGQEIAKRPPGLGVILVGDDEASKAYVANKERTATRCGFRTVDFKLPKTATFTQVADAIASLNADSSVDGILLQLPLPKHLDSDALIDRIDPSKDADGLHPYNQGLLMRGAACLRPCTPLGCLRLIDLALCGQSLESAEFDMSTLPEADLSGKSAVVIGRSLLVGKPIAMMLLERNATVTIAHSRSPDLPQIVKGADIVIAAVGRPNMVKGDWIKQGAIVIDVGINRLESGKLTGDVAFDEVETRASAITPVPGGVGPMTISMLLQNTLTAFKNRSVK